MADQEKRGQRIPKRTLGRRNGLREKGGGAAQESDPNLAGHLPAHIQYQVFESIEEQTAKNYVFCYVIRSLTHAYFKRTTDTEIGKVFKAPRTSKNKYPLITFPRNQTSETSRPCQIHMKTAGVARVARARKTGRSHGAAAAESHSVAASLIAVLRSLSHVVRFRCG